MTKKPKRIAVIMRSYNDSKVIRGTLDMLSRQTISEFDLWNFDSTSNDGTLDIIKEYNIPQRVRQNDSASYIPGQVLNEAIQCVESEILVFLNSDATPVDEFWLERLIEPLKDSTVGAVYGRQIGRPDCRSLFEKDTERAFGDGSEASRWLHFFSMANSAARRKTLLKYPFETCMQYSEDVDWSYRLRLNGHRIHYAGDAVAMHSHNYTLKQSYRRHYGEGVADSVIFRRGELQQDLARTFMMPFAMEVLRDMKWALDQHSFDAAVHSIPLRFVQKWARWRGQKKGQQSVQRIVDTAMGV